jgi:hypothetical protein
MARQRTIVFFLVWFTTTLGIASATRGAGPADPLLRLVPADAGLTIVVEDLRNNAREFFASPLFPRLRDLPAVKEWFASERGRGFDRARRQIGSILGADFATVRDGLLGEAVVLTLRVPPGRRPNEARGLLLTRVTDRALLDRTVTILNDAQKKKGEMVRVSERRRGEAVYFVREFLPGLRPDEFYAHLDGSVFAWSNSEELIRDVIDRQARGPGGLAELPAVHEVRRRLPEGAAATALIDPRFVAQILAASSRPRKPGEERLHALIGRYLAAVRHAGASVSWRDGLVLHTEEVVDPEKLGPSLRAWASRTDRPGASLARIPGTALAVASVHLDAGVVLDALASLVSDADQTKLGNLGVAVNGILLGQDLRADVAPRLGPGLTAFVDRTEPGGAQVVLQAEIANGPEGEKAGAALDNALRTLLAVHALDDKQGGGKLRLASRTVGDAKVTALAPVTPYAYAVSDGRLVLGRTEAAVARALTARPDPSAGAWFERLRAARFPSALSYACADLQAIHAYAEPRRVAIARRSALRQNRPEADAARDLDQALALIHLFDAAYATSAVDPDFRGVHRTFGLVTLPAPLP